MGKFESDSQTARQQLSEALGQVKQVQRTARLEQTKLSDDFETRSEELTRMCRAKVRCRHGGPGGVPAAW